MDNCTRTHLLLSFNLGQIVDSFRASSLQLVVNRRRDFQWWENDGQGKGLGVERCFRKSPSRFRLSGTLELDPFLVVFCSLFQIGEGGIDTCAFQNSNSEEILVQFPSTVSNQALLSSEHNDTNG